MVIMLCCRMCIGVSSLSLNSKSNKGQQTRTTCRHAFGPERCHRVVKCRNQLRTNVYRRVTAWLSVVMGRYFAGVDTSYRYTVSYIVMISIEIFVISRYSEISRIAISSIWNDTFRYRHGS